MQMPTGGLSFNDMLFVLGQVTASNVDISRVAPHYHIYTQAEVEAVIERL